MRHVLLNPGPVVLSDAVRAALTRTDLCHREPEFAELQGAVRAGLLRVADLPAEAWSAVLVAGSGTAAVEALVASLVPRGRALAVVANGVYGERVAAIAAAHGIEHEVLALGWGDEVAPAAVAELLARRPDFAGLAVVHHETTTGRLNDLEAVGAVARAAGVPLLVDAVSSFGAEELDLERWGVAALAGTANKCLHGAPGISFVVARRAALAAACEPPRGVYLDLARHAAQQDAGSTAFTQPVHVLHALSAALDEHAQQGGWRARRARYRELAERVRATLSDLGVEPWLDPAASSACLRAYALPAGRGYAELHDGLKERGFVIYAGQGALERRIFRIATLGAISDADVDRLDAALRDVLAR